MIKRTGIAILLGLSGFGLGTLVALMTDGKLTLQSSAEAHDSRLRHITQLPSGASPMKAKSAHVLPAALAKPP